MKWFRRSFLMLWLAWADLLHECLLTACLVCTVAAVASPLLLLNGLKAGVVQTLRARLLDDPTIREVQPAFMLPSALPAGWLEDLARRPGVAYVAPRRGGASVALSFRSKHHSTSLEADALPCTVGHPVLRFFHAAEPGANEVVLSEGLAHELGCRCGDQVQCFVARGGTSGRREEVSANLTVIAVMPAAASATAKVWIHADFLDDVDHYRRGQPVLQRGWQGELEEPAPRYDGFLILTNKADALPVLESQNRTLGMLAFASMPGSATAPLVGLKSWPAEVQWIHATTRTGFPFAVDKLSAAAAALSDKEQNACLVLPLVTRAIPVRLEAHGYVTEKRLSVLDEFVHSSEGAMGALKELRARLCDSVPGAPLPENALSALPAKQPHRFNVLVKQWEQNEEATLHFDSRGKEVVVPVNVRSSPLVADGVVIVDQRLGGQCLRAQREAIQWCDELSLFDYQPTGFRDFHVFAERLEDVGPLVDHLSQSGIQANSRIDDIARVLRIDRYLTQLLKIVSGVAATAGFLALFSSFFSSISRKRRELGILQLLGRQRYQLMLFPLFQSLSITVMGLGLSMAIYAWVAAKANEQLADEFGVGGQFCLFDWRLSAPMLLGALLLAIIASMIAATRIILIQPSHAIRDD